MLISVHAEVLGDANFCSTPVPGVISDWIATLRTWPIDYRVLRSCHAFAQGDLAEKYSWFVLRSFAESPYKYLITSVAVDRSRILKEIADAFSARRPRFLRARIFPARWRRRFWQPPALRARV